MRIGGDSDRLRLMRSDVASQQPDDAWTSRGNLERPEHPRRPGRGSPSAVPANFAKVPAFHALHACAQLVSQGLLAFCECSGLKYFQ